ncbi:anhydro-N-acetylmuramic acid kinase [Neisseriaceae bacterium TC5R-5]|nr:anhydro-N-acetylmuramic acid kinase [Neisseriaceae bacterium TC5R-5]
MHSTQTQAFIGLMSGTSLDGVDALLAHFTASGQMSVEADLFVAYPADVRQQILALQDVGDNELDRSARLSNTLAELYASACLGLLQQQARQPEQICAIACHGQTIRHAPQAGYSCQIGNMARLAELTGIDVIADFRSRDLAAGGQGAPLVPAFHQALFACADEKRVIMNIGGISNLTRLHVGQAVIGFDCGPGNMLLDAWCLRHRGQAYDADGQWAAQGQVHPLLLERLLQQAFFQQAPPKSTGRDLFNLGWLEDQLSELVQPPSAVDIQASLLALSAHSMAQAIQQFCPGNQAVFVCGGGANNSQLMQLLSQHLPGQKVSTTASLGLPPQQVEAAAFAWLGWCFGQRLAGNLADVTGAVGARVLGALFPR